MNIPTWEVHGPLRGLGVPVQIQTCNVALTPEVHSACLREHETPLKKIDRENALIRTKLFIYRIGK